MRQQLDSTSPDATFRLPAAAVAAAHDEGTRVGNMSQIGEPDQLRWRNQTTRNNGKLKLAAVVHYDSLELLGGGGEANSAKKHGDDDDVQKGADLKQKTEPSERQTVGRNSHVDAQPNPTKKAAGRLSRLFFLKNATNKKNKPNESLEGDLIDDTRRPDGLQLEQHIQQPSGPTTSKLEGGEHSTQVIEFKFDLIVEGDRRETLLADAGDDGRGEKASESTKDDEILRPIRQRKLLDQVNELVESFVLDSMDVCLLTAGRRRLACAAGSSSSQFDYLLKCAKLTITYAFQLLEATGGDGGGVWPAADCSGAHSIELEAVLFEQSDKTDGSSGTPLLNVVDLVSVAALRNESAPANGQQVTARECKQIGQAIEQLHLVRLKLDEIVAASSALASNRVLMMKFKLMRQVNGATFSNRMCLLDMAEPATSRLATVVGTIFSGQALAHLKRQEVLLRTLEMQTGAGSADGAANNDDENSQLTSTNNKHFHQIASLTQLIRAEWLIYKQLSSALIKTLAIVHCHRLDSASVPPDQRRVVAAAERRLMDYNLGLLEFVHRLRRGAKMRLKRRKRHLRSLLARSDHGLISDTNLSLASSIDELAQSPPPTSSSLATIRQQCPRAVRDLMITSPLRQRLDQTLSPSVGNNDRRRGLRLMSSDLDRDQRRQQRAHQHAHHLNHHRHHHRHRDRQFMTTARRRVNYSRHHQRPINRASSLNRASYWATSELDVARDSSSPTSTPSSGCRRNYNCQNRDEMLMSLDGTYSFINANLRPNPASETKQLRRDSPPGPALNNSAAVRCSRKRSMITESDPDDSMASLNSVSLTSRLHSPAGGRSQKVSTNFISDPRIRRHIQQQQQLPLDSPSDSNTLDDSIELQSFSSSVGQHQHQQQAAPMVPTGDHWRGGPQELGASLSDCTSETCCAIKVAEPPRQLKLEEFLNQLSNFIGPNAAQPASARPDGGATPIPRNNNDEEEEEDDCKSHSSILEHLSSLTLESNLKMVKQTQRQQVSSTDRVSIVNESDCDKNRAWPHAGGHLQSLLKSTLKLQQEHSGRRAASQGVDLAKHLRVLTIDCKPVEPARVEPSASQTNKTSSSSLLLGPSETPPTSMDSGSCVSCSSSSSSSTSGSSPRSRNAVPAASSIRL